MSILADYGNNVQAYIDHEKHKDSVCPTGCSLCGGMNCLRGHGYYLRKAKGEQQAYLIWIKRWFCKNCHGTQAVIPNFMLPYRHYLVRVVQAVVTAFYESAQSWKGVSEGCAQGGDAWPANNAALV